MKKYVYHILGVVALTALLTGCETAKSTISGPFIGMEKDAHNFADASGKLLNGALNDGEDGQQRGTLRRIDDWMQKNMW